MAVQTRKLRMSRKPKGPTAEELIQKLQEYVDEFKESNQKNIESIKSENEASIQVIQENIENTKNALESLKDQSSEKNNANEDTFANIDEKLSNSNLVNTEQAEKIASLENALEEVKTFQENNKENVQSQITEINTEFVTSIEEIKMNLNEQIENIMTVMTNERADAKIKMDNMKSDNCDTAIQLQTRMDKSIKDLTEKILNETRASENTKGDMDMEMISFKTQVDALIARVDDVNEKMYEFEQNKRNNLLFYGIPNDTRETPGQLLQKIASILKTTLCVSRDIPVLKASRVLIGPDVSGSRPVVVTFENYKDKEDVLRKGGLLKGSNIHVTEDMNKKTRDSRMELRRFMRAVKRNNPGANYVLHYDKLYVDNKVFVYNDIKGKVIEQTHEEENGGIFPLPSPRPYSVMTDNGSISPVGLYKDKDKMMKRTQSLFSMGEEDLDNMMREKDDTIIQLKNVIRKMEDDMEKMKNGIYHELGDTNSHDEHEDTNGHVEHEDTNGHGEHEDTNGHGENGFED